MKRRWRWSNRPLLTRLILPDPGSCHGSATSARARRACLRGDRTAGDLRSGVVRGVLAGVRWSPSLFGGAVVKGGEMNGATVLLGLRMKALRCWFRVFRRPRGALLCFPARGSPHANSKQKRRQRPPRCASSRALPCYKIRALVFRCSVRTVQQHFCVWST